MGIIDVNDDDNDQGKKKNSVVVQYMNYWK